ncbi:MAG: hypothetical protein JNM93_02425 [Bacteriovoracaceae bacterium]|nr:hypothetical protein [Bacteriovoracaceae bacterium]
MSFLFILLLSYFDLNAMEVLKAKGHKAVIKHAEEDKVQVGQILNITDAGNTPMGKFKITKVEGKFALGVLESGIIREGFIVHSQPNAVPVEAAPAPVTEPQPVVQEEKPKEEPVVSQAPETKEQPNIYGASYISFGAGVLNSSAITDNTDNIDFTPGSWSNFYFHYGSVGKTGIIFETELFSGSGSTSCTAADCGSATEFDNTEYGLNFYLGYHFTPSIYLKLGLGGRYLNFENSTVIDDFQLFGYQYGAALGYIYQFNSFFFMGVEAKYMMTQFTKSISDTPTLDLNVDITQTYTNFMFRFGFMF